MEKEAFGPSEILLKHTLSKSADKKAFLEFFQECISLL